MLSVIYKLCMLNDVKLDVVVLSVVMLNVVAPNKMVKFAKKTFTPKKFYEIDPVVKTAIAVFFISL
jgi:hypothetical protein